MKRNALLTSILICFTTSSYSGVYISYDSLQPSYEQDLAKAQIETLRDLSNTNRRMAQSSEFVVSELIGFQREQQQITDAKVDNMMSQTIMLEKQRNLQLDEKKDLIKQSHAIESQRIDMLRESHQRENDLIALQIEQTQYAYNQQDLRQKSFLEEQAKIQKETLSLQRKTQESSDKVLATQLALNAPSNLIVASKDAENLKQVTTTSDANNLQNLSKANQASPVVNLNEFVRSILPSNWTYIAPSGLDNETINVVQGKDWQSILNHIAINNKHLEIFINPYTKEVIITNTMQYANAPKSASDPFRTWHVSTSRTLKGNLEEFAKQAKWVLIWDTQEVDYPTVAPAVIQGDFSSENGIVNSLIKSTARKEFPLFADWNTKNNVVRIIRMGAKK
ncbi:TcpQ domain-containing protein [Vibrio anguillarum]|nr:TcpQ domain-containing protein [Vibrio anguillarum]